MHEGTQWSMFVVAKLDLRLVVKKYIDIHLFTTFSHNSVAAAIDSSIFRFLKSLLKYRIQFVNYNTYLYCDFYTVLKSLQQCKFMTTKYILLYEATPDLPFFRFVTSLSFKWSSILHYKISTP